MPVVNKSPKCYVLTVEVLNARTEQTSEANVTVSADCGGQQDMAFSLASTMGSR